MDASAFTDTLGLRYALSLLHFMAVDPAVPKSTRMRMQALGLCKDEYNRSAHWMYVVF